MDITVYLPDALGKWAKDAELNLSRMLRDAVNEELERRNIVSATLNEETEQIIEVATNDDLGRHKVRFTGREIASDDDSSVYVTDDKRIIIFYSTGGYAVWDIDTAMIDLVDIEQLLEGLSQAVYVKAMKALGLEPVIDL